MTTGTITKAADYWVRKDDLRTGKYVDAPTPADVQLGDGQVMIQVDLFAMTSNNITYAAFGEMMNYWSFFPTGEDGWGRVPVWGFGDVIASNCDGIAVGERYWGYFPMSSYLVLEPTKVTEYGFVDNMSHRRELVGTYNNYTRTSADVSYDADREAEQAVLKPMFSTSFILDDFAADNDFFGAKSVIITSASSKTSIGLGFLLHNNRSDQVIVIGLTSAGNKAFCRGLGIYDQVVTYDDVDSMDARVPTMVVDMAGNGAVTKALHNHFGDNLRYDCLVGGTHWEKISMDHEGLPGTKPQGFFAPDQFVKRAKDWGAAGLQARMGEAWQSFTGPVSGWISMNEQRGWAAVEATYLLVLNGDATPDNGYVLSLNENKT